MILRRITEHVKTQNWFAVALDLVIVVVGVFIGIQVANWNEAQRAQTRADDYAERLRADLRIELEHAEGLIDYYKSALSSGTDAYAGLMRATDATDATVLVNAYRATQYSFYERRRSTFDEIISSGMLNLIADSELRETAVLVFATPVLDAVMEEGQTARYRELFRMAVDPALQGHLSQQCGDQLVEAVYGAVALVSLDYPCALTAGAAEISAAVATLREDEDVVRALRLRNVQLAGRVGDLQLMIDTLGLTRLFAEEAVGQ